MVSVWAEGVLSSKRGGCFHVPESRYIYFGGAGVRNTPESVKPHTQQVAKRSTRSMRTEIRSSRNHRLRISVAIYIVDHALFRTHVSAVLMTCWPGCIRTAPFRDGLRSDGSYIPQRRYVGIAHSTATTVSGVATCPSPVACRLRPEEARHKRNRQTSSDSAPPDTEF